MQIMLKNKDLNWKPFVITFLLTLWCAGPYEFLIGLVSSFFLVFLFDENDMFYLLIKDNYEDFFDESNKLISLIVEGVTIFILIDIIIFSIFPYFTPDFLWGIFYIIVFICIFFYIRFKMISKGDIEKIVVHTKEEFNNNIFLFKSDNYSILESNDNYVKLSNDFSIKWMIIVFLVVWFVIGFFSIFLQFIYWGDEFYLSLRVILSLLILGIYILSYEKNSKIIQIEIQEVETTNDYKFCHKCGTKLKADDIFWRAA